jgi:hypothetical protein
MHTIKECDLTFKVLRWLHKFSKPLVSSAGWYVSPLVSRFVTCRPLQQTEEPGSRMMVNQALREKLNDVEQTNSALQKKLNDEYAKVESLFTMVNQLKMQTETDQIHHEAATLQLKRSHEWKEAQLATEYASELNKFESVNAHLFAGLKSNLKEVNMAMAESITTAAGLEKTVQLKDKQLFVANNEAKVMEIELVEMKLNTEKELADKLSAMTLYESQMQIKSTKLQETVQELTSKLVKQSKDLEQAEKDKSDALNKIEMSEAKNANALSRKQTQIKNLGSKEKEHIRQIQKKNEKLESSRKEVADGQVAYKKLEGDLKSFQETTQEQRIAEGSQIESRVVELESQVKTWTSEADRYSKLTTG